MSARRDPETQPDAVTDKSGPEKEQLQTPRLLEAKDDDDDEVMLAITDAYMNNIDLSVVYGELSGRIFILENEEPIAEVRDSGIVNDLGIEIHHEQLQFESTEEEIAWITSIREDVRKLRLSMLQGSSSSSGDYISGNSNLFGSQKQLMNKMVPLEAQQSLFGKNKRRSLQGTAGIIQLSQQFDDKFKEYAKFNSKEEEVIARKFVQMMEGVCSSEMRKFDPKAIAMQPMERQILFQKVQQKLANRLWKVPFVAPPAYGEQMLMSRNAVESASMIQHVFLDLIFQLGLGKTESFMEKLIDGYKLALLATGEAQNVCEQLSGVYTKPDTTEIYSETTKQRMTGNKKLKEVNCRPSRFSIYSPQAGGATNGTFQSRFANFYQTFQNKICLSIGCIAI
ncbi:MAG: hypothetical protein EZS28_039840, partial [Streblomastix strix]